MQRDVILPQSGVVQGCPAQRVPLPISLSLCTLKEGRRGPRSRPFATLIGASDRARKMVQIPV